MGHCALLASGTHALTRACSTERDYLRDLIWVVTQYVKPIEDQQLLSKDDHKQLFSNISSLVQLHTEILSMLEQSGTGDFAIGQTFVKIGSYLKVYATYVIDQDGTREFIERKRQERPAFAKLCLGASRARCVRLVFVRVVGFAAPTASRR